MESPSGWVQQKTSCCRVDDITSRSSFVYRLGFFSVLSVLSSSTGATLVWSCSFRVMFSSSSSFDRGSFFPYGFVFPRTSLLPTQHVDSWKGDQQKKRFTRLFRYTHIHAPIEIQPVQGDPDGYQNKEDLFRRYWNELKSIEQDKDDPYRYKNIRYTDKRRWHHLKVVQKTVKSIRESRERTATYVKPFCITTLTDDTFGKLTATQRLIEDRKRNAKNREKYLYQHVLNIPNEELTNQAALEETARPKIWQEEKESSEEEVEEDPYEKLLGPENELDKISVTAANVARRSEHPPLDQSDDPTVSPLPLTEEDCEAQYYKTREQVKALNIKEEDDIIKAPLPSERIPKRIYTIGFDADEPIIEHKPISPFEAPLTKRKKKQKKINHREEAARKAFENCQPLDFFPDLTKKYSRNFLRRHRQIDRLFLTNLGGDPVPNGFGTEPTILRSNSRKNVEEGSFGNGLPLIDEVRSTDIADNVTKRIKDLCANEKEIKKNVKIEIEKEEDRRRALRSKNLTPEEIQNEENRQRQNFEKLFNSFTQSMKTPNMETNQ